MDHIFPLSHPGVVWLEELCQFGFTSGWAWLRSESWWEVKENPVGFLVMGLSLGEDVASSSLGLSHESRLFLLVLGPLWIMPHLP